ncbi:hypothetical protein DMUE_1851 [Dictyocoela muelleri]|nr:hypothetical protein DMUE_1851 [Dictyocoela muelleri]
MSNVRENNENLDMKNIKINGKKSTVLFDTSSSLNILTEKTLKKLNCCEFKRLEVPIEIKLLNGSIIRANSAVLHSIEHHDIVVKDTFHITNKGIIDIQCFP